MANTKSAKKAIRQSARKRANNLFWKKRIKTMTRALTKTLETNGSAADILNKEQATLQKVLDKAAKNKVIHQNKADRLKSAYAKRISAQTNPVKANSTAAPAKAAKSPRARGKSKS